MRRVGAAALTTALVGLVAAPASAATVVARASATSVVVTAGGQPAGSGTYEVTHDGTSQTSTGTNRPRRLRAHRAVARCRPACSPRTPPPASRVATGTPPPAPASPGTAPSVVAVGDGDCLSPGNTLSLSAGTLDLSGLRVVDFHRPPGPGPAGPGRPRAGPRSRRLRAPGRPADRLCDSSATPGCSSTSVPCRAAARPVSGTASGDASLAGVAAYAQVAGRRVDLLSLPVHPAPNTNVATNLTAVAAAVKEALRSQLGTALDGALGPLGAAVDQAAVLDNVLVNVSSHLGPLDQNLLSGTLNKQSQPSAGAIDVTALDLDVLPAAAQFGMQALSLQVGRSTCGPSGQGRPRRSRRRGAAARRAAGRPQAPDASDPGHRRPGR